MVFVFARGASHTTRPAQFRNRINANLFIAEVFDCFLKRCWLVHGIPHKPNPIKPIWVSQVYYCRRISVKTKDLGRATEIFSMRKPLIDINLKDLVSLLPGVESEEKRLFNLSLLNPAGVPVAEPG